MPGCGFRPAFSEELLWSLTAGRHPDYMSEGLISGRCYLAQLHALQQSFAIYARTLSWQQKR